MNQHFYLQLPQDFNFEECRRFLARSDRECLHLVSEDCITKWAEINGENLFFEVYLADNHALKVHCSHAGQNSQKAIEDYLTSWFDLDRSLTPFYEMAKQDAILPPITAQHHGLRLIGIPDLFEALSWSVIGQQINLAFAYNLKSRLVENWGDAVDVNGQKYGIFPRPEQVAKLEVEDFMPFQYSRRKAEYLIGIARLMAEGQLSKAQLQQQSFEEALNSLVGIRGIGPWSAHYVLMKCLRHTEAYPAQDAGLHQALRRQLDLPSKPSKEMLEELGEAWGEWKAYAVFYLWQSLLGKK